MIMSISSLLFSSIILSTVGVFSGAWGRYLIGLMSPGALSGDVVTFSEDISDDAVLLISKLLVHVWLISDAI